MEQSREHTAKEPFSLSGCLLAIALLYGNSIGIVGALVDILEIPWREVGKRGPLTGLEPISFWGVLLLFCVAAVLVKSGASGKKTFVRLSVCAVLYIIVGFLFRDLLSGGLSIALEDVIGNLNERYQFHIVWTAAKVQADWDAGMRTLALTCGILYALFPLELLAGLLGRYDRGFCLLTVNAVWFTLACLCDRFPGFFFLAFCVIGAVAALVQNEFRKRPKEAAVVALSAAVLTGLVIAVVYFFILPVMDRQYEENQESRWEFYRLVNEEWIPKAKEVLPGGGFGPGADVTGELGRNNLFAYTAEDVYRVTVSRKPQGTIYLKGYMGGTYEETEWAAQSDRELEDYYREQGMELPEDFRALVNFSHAAAKELQQDTSPAYILIEELGWRGSYSIYPYGALLTEEYRVHGDGSVVRKDREYGFQYYASAGYGGRVALPAELARTEEDYRRYVYDHFLEYPEEKLPRLTACLEAEDISTDSIYACALDLIRLLDRQADYNLDAENNPSGTDFVEYFLFDSREGYCEHFASAAVLALRYFGIPARYVAGYAVSPSDFASGGGGIYTAMVSSRQAHAWAEIYLDSIGWVPVEMTPGAVAFPEDNRAEQLGQLGQYGQTADSGLAWTQEGGLWQQDSGTGQQDTGAGQWDASEESGGSGAEKSDKNPTEPNVMDAQNGNQGSLSPEENPESGILGDGSESGGDVRQEPEYQETGSGALQTAEMIFRIVIIVLTFCMLPAGLLCLEKWDESRRREKYRRADRRERIFLLYRNFRSAFLHAGIGQNLAVDGERFRHILLDSYQVSQEEYEAFCHILEKNSFGEEEPSEEELEQVRSLHDRLLKDAYGRARFYRKPFIRRYQGCV